MFMEYQMHLLYTYMVHSEDIRIILFWDMASAEEHYNEKEINICRVVKDYYRTTFKDTNRYMYKLQRIANENILEIIVAGHSITGIDVPYFSNIDILSGKNVNWTIVWFDSSKKDMIRQSLIDAGIDGDRIQLKPANEFYDL